MNNTKNTKRALLVSLVSILLCFSMLVGSTFAWFTDTATTSVNTIQAGTLDVALEMFDGTNWVSAEGKTLDFIAADGNKNILWEPGCTYNLPELRIVGGEENNLAFKYQVVITGINGDAKLNQAIEWMINGEPIAAFEGKVFPETEPAEGENKFVISGHMKADAGNEYQKLTIDGIAITVVATQLNYEYDSNDNTYDEGAVYYRVNEAGTIMIDSAAALLTWARDINNDVLKTNRMVVEIEKDVDLTGYQWSPINLWDPDGGVNVTINGNGHTIKGMDITANGNKNKGFISSKTGALTINELTFEKPVIEDCASFTGVVVGYNYGDITLNKVTVTGASVKGRSNVADIRIGGLIGFVPSDAEGTVTITNCAVKDSNFYGYHNVAGLVGSLHVNTINITGNTVSGCTFTLCTTSANAKNYTNALYVNQGFTRDYTVDQGDNKFNFAVAVADQDALNAALQDETATVLSLGSGTFAMNGANAINPAEGKTIIGNGETVLDNINGFKNCTFENVVINDIYTLEGSTLIDCVIKAPINDVACATQLNGTATFEGCTFTANGAGTSLWFDAVVDNATATFTDCVFVDNIRLGGDDTNKYTFTNCEFQGGTVNWSYALVITYAPTTFDTCTFNVEEPALYGVRVAVGMTADDVTLVNTTTPVMVP